MTSTTAPDLYYDPYDYDVDVDAQAVWKRLRDEAPVYRNEQFDFYALTRYDDVLPAMLDTETYSSAHATTIELMGSKPVTAPMMIWMDPPDHTRFRRAPSPTSRTASGACARRCWTRSSAATASTTSTGSAPSCLRR